MGYPRRKGKGAGASTDAPFEPLPEWTVLSIESKGRENLVRVEFDARPQRCPACRSEGVLALKRSNDQELRDLPFEGRYTLVLARRAAYRCRACGKVVTPPIPGSFDGARMTTRLAEYIEAEAKEWSMPVVALRVGIAEATVRKLLIKLRGRSAAAPTSEP